MLDEPEENGGKINWPVAIAISLCAHALLLGLFWAFSGSKEPASALASPAEPAVTKPVEQPPAPPSAPAETVRPPESAPPAPVQTPAPARPPRTTPAPTPPASSAPESVETENYVVKPGDFLSRIANKCKCTVADIKHLNGAAAEKTLHPGDVLKVPVRR